MNGKGDKTRPLTVSRKIWDENWEKIFGKKKKKIEKKKKKKKKKKNIKSKN